MDFTCFEFMTILKNQDYNTRDLIVLQFLNKNMKGFMNKFMFPCCTCFMIAGFSRWKHWTSEQVYEKKYKRRTSWVKQKKNSENTELVLF